MVTMGLSYVVQVNASDPDGDSHCSALFAMPASLHLPVSLKIQEPLEDVILPEGEGSLARRISNTTSEAGSRGCASCLK